MNLMKIAEERELKIREMNNFTLGIKAEKREMNDEETSKLAEMRKEVEDLNKKIDDIRKSDSNEYRNDNIDKKNKEINMNKNFSFRNAIADAMYGTFSDETLKYVEKIKEDRNGFSMPTEIRATIAADTSDETGGYAVSKEYWNILEPLKSNLAVTSMGAKFLTGLKGDQVLPTYAGTTAYWKGEVVAAVDGAGSFGQITFTPKKLTASFIVSKQFLAQDTVGAEMMLRDQASYAIQEKLDATILGKAAHSADAPDGFFTTGFSFDVTSAATYAKIVELESKVNSANGLKNNLGYIIHPTLKGTLKATQKFANAGTGIIDGNELNGYKFVDTTNIATGLSTGPGVTGGTYYGVVFGNWSDYVICQFGNLDVSVNPWIYDAEGLIRVTITGWFDAKPVRNASFAVGALI